SAPPIRPADPRGAGGAPLPRRAARPAAGPGPRPARGAAPVRTRPRAGRGVMGPMVRESDIPRLDVPSAGAHRADPERDDRRTPYRRTGRSGLDLPSVSLGLWHNFGDDRDLSTQRAVLRRAFDLGVTHFDLANNYGPPPGSAELNFGRILREDFRAYRDELII